MIQITNENIVKYHVIIPISNASLRLKTRWFTLTLKQDENSQLRVTVVAFL